MKIGQIRFHGATTDVSCVVTDISVGGAQIELPKVAGVPSEFRLTLDGVPVRNCFVRWRSSYTMGVEFLPSHAASLDA